MAAFKAGQQKMKKFTCPCLLPNMAYKIVICPTCNNLPFATIPVFIADETTISRLFCWDPKTSKAGC